ncbi:MAG: YbaN family protein, partial [Alcanivorax sp.]
MGTVRVLCWRSLAMLFVLLGMIGVVVPGMPTVVFLLLAAWAGSHGWPQLERWLLQHPRHGGHIRQWREHGDQGLPGVLAAIHFRRRPTLSRFRTTGLHSPPLRAAAIR